MNISTHTKVGRSALRTNRAPQAEQTQTGPQDSFTLASRKQKRVMKKAIGFTAGAVGGGYLVSNLTDGLAGTVANVAGGVGGAVIGGVAGGIVGGFIGAKLHDGPGSIGAFLGYGMIGAGLGAAGGAWGGAVAELGTQGILTTAAGVVAGGAGALALMNND